MGTLYSGDLFATGYHANAVMQAGGGSSAACDKGTRGNGVLFYSFVTPKGSHDGVAL
jgi:hypothetical protein